MRPRTACSTCRQRQRRCLVQSEARNVACEFCVRNQQECSLAASTTSPAVDHSPGQEHQTEIVALPENLGLRMPPADAYLEIASNYFTYIHDPSHNVFHRPSFMADLSSGAVPLSIQFCVIALAARFSSHPFFSHSSPRSRGKVFAREAERQLDLHNVSLVTLQTALLLGAFYGTEGDSLHESLYYSLACRIGCLLNLPDSACDTPLIRELGIRLWWTLDIIDVWSSNSVQLPRLLNPRTDVPLPTSDRAFLQMRRSHSYLQFSQFESQGESSNSVLVQKIKLNPILSEIAKLNRTLAEKTLSLYETHAATEALGRRLDEWREQLPESLSNTSENLFAQSASGSGGSFVALHIGFYHFSQLLYFYYLNQSASGDPTSKSNVFSGLCRESSTALCELLYAAQALPGAEVYYSMVGHALVISSAVQLHIFLFTDDEEQSCAARQRLERNFVILSRLQKLWRTIDHAFARFRDFHGACMRTKADLQDPSSTFRMDKWMIQFLMEFSKPLEQRRDLEYRSPDSSSSEYYDLESVEQGTDSEFRRWTSVDLGIDIGSQELSSNGWF